MTNTVGFKQFILLSVILLYWIHVYNSFKQLKRLSSLNIDMEEFDSGCRPSPGMRKAENFYDESID